MSYTVGRGSELSPHDSLEKPGEKLSLGVAARLSRYLQVLTQARKMPTAAQERLAFGFLSFAVRTAGEPAEGGEAGAARSAGGSPAARGGWWSRKEAEERRCRGACGAGGGGRPAAASCSTARNWPEGMPAR